MSMIKLNQQSKTIDLKEISITNSIIFNFFDKVPTNDRDETLLRALYIGVLALMEDRISAFLSKTSNELGTELESLKILFDLKQELFYKTAVKGSLAEEDIVEFLNNHFKDKKILDTAHLTGNETGNLPRNKTGDIICRINGDSDLKIAIECKFDKSIKLGNIESKDVFTRKYDTAWSQLIESDANRASKVSIIVFDISIVDNSILKIVENVGFIQSIGFVAIIDSQKGDYSNLAIAYMLARDIAINAKNVDLDKDVLAIIVNRIIKDINEITNIKRLVEGNIENNKAILKQLEKSILLMEFNQDYLSKFLNDGTLTKKDLLDFYMGEGVKDKYKPIEKEINELI
ncbi:hypothetical protein EZV76_15650 [Flagellimonas alvinocaridis]|uniref:Uncharacterized protein n=2 Tax=Flagellimonas alvinocaridis TaxID=2530200 RepID=A0A4S8RFX5_9FLAO|nr:hypothetical protein EZV76_15650 [Allomuricauda alvinocaridis]